MQMSDSGVDRYSRSTSKFAENWLQRDIITANSIRLALIHILEMQFAVYKEICLSHSSPAC